MVLNYYDEFDLDQCDLANTLLDRDDCCPCQFGSSCDTRCPDDGVEVLYDMVDFEADRQNSVPEFAALVAEITAGRPVEIGIKSGNMGHLAILKWAGPNFGEDSVAINDPFFDEISTTYEEMISSGAAAAWTGIEPQ
jgi:hypothetical protein